MPAARPHLTVVQRADALALSIGSRITVSTLMLACVLTIAVGAASLLDTLHKMDRDLKVMNEQLLVANKGTEMLNVYLTALPRTTESLRKVVGTVEATSKQVSTSGTAISGLSGQTRTMNVSLARIAGSTGAMRGSLETHQGSTKELAATVDTLNGKLGPLVKTQGDMLQGTRRMQRGLCAMNGSLAYVLRQLNYLTAPPGTNAGFTVRVELDKSSLPPVPGVAAVTEPVPVFPRGAWPVYNEKGLAPEWRAGSPWCP